MSTPTDPAPTDPAPTDPTEQPRAWTLGAVDVGTALEHHLLVVPDDVAPEEVEALALSRFPGARRTDDGVVLTPSVRLTGPWWAPRMPELGLPAGTRRVYLTHAPRQRGGAVPRELRGRGGLLDAFADGEPVGTESEVIDFLLAAARRLGGALRVEGRFGLVLTPEPRPDLVVFSSTWLPSSELVRALSEQLPGLALPEVGGAAAGTGTGAGADAAAVPQVPEAAPEGMDEAERRWLHAEADAFDAAALDAATHGHLSPSTGYSTTTVADDGSVFSVVVEPVDRVPLVVAAHAWARHGAVCYELRHHHHEQSPHPDAAATRPRGIDLRGATIDPGPIIDNATAALHARVGGEVVDDDGFLVALS